MPNQPICGCIATERLRRNFASLMARIGAGQPAVGITDRFRHRERERLLRFESPNQEENSP